MLSEDDGGPAFSNEGIPGWPEVAIVGEASGRKAADGADAGAGLLRDVAWRFRPPGAVVVAGRPDTPGIPLLAARPLVAGRPAAYVCRGMVCDAPMTDPEALRGQLVRA